MHFKDLLRLNCFGNAASRPNSRCSLLFINTFASSCSEHLKFIKKHDNIQYYQSIIEPDDLSS